MKLSVVMAVCNEEPHMQAAIEHANTYADEIIVVVQESRDHTLDLAYQFADIVIEHPCYGFCEPSRAAGFEAATGDWVLVLDADERLSDYGIQNIRAWIETAHYDGYRLRELTLVGGIKLEDAPHGRLFRKGCVTVPTTVHTEPQCATGRVGTKSGKVVINHFKTRQEQTYDDIRYRKIMYPDVV